MSIFSRRKAAPGLIQQAIPQNEDLFPGVNKQKPPVKRELVLPDQPPNHHQSTSSQQISVQRQRLKRAL